MSFYLDYTDGTFVENLPYGFVYQFKVGIYDNNQFYLSSESNDVDLGLSNNSLFFFLSLISTPLN